VEKEHAAEKKAVGIVPRYESSLKRKIGIVVAGTAGERVQSSAHMLVEAAVLSGANATQKNDNPITQGTGFSLSEVVLSRDEIHYTGIDIPDVLIVTSEDGVSELKSQGVFQKTGDHTLLVIDDSLEIPKCAGKIARQPLRRKYSPSGAAFAGILFAVKATGILPMLAFQDVAARQKKSEGLLSIIEQIAGIN
jgi:Pyruvate/2-oxoacid:ferredoxin oxidoreductase gamma subunit